jgi:hypothetical protein
VVEAETPRKGGRPILMLMEHFGVDVKEIHACGQDSGVGVVKERELLGVLAPLLFEIVLYNAPIVAILYMQMRSWNYRKYDTEILLGP